MKNLLSGVLLCGSLMVATVPSVAAAAHRSAGTNVVQEASLVAAFAPMSTATSSAVVTSTDDPPVVVTRAFYSDMLDYLQAQVAYEGAVHDSFVALGLSGDQLAALDAAQGRLTNSALTLIDYINNNITAA